MNEIPAGMTLLEREQDFHWYKAGMDVAARYNHRHNHEPKEYPCLVKSEWWDNPNGPDEYTHMFFYKKEVTCESCGHKTKEWDFSTLGDE